MLLRKLWAAFTHAVWWLCFHWLYDLAWFVNRGINLWLGRHRVTIEGGDRIPRRGGFLITANHMSQWDIIFVYLLLPGPSFFMTKREYFEMPFMGGFVRLMGAFPVSRSRYDRQSLQYSIDLLKRGQRMIIFPEGTRSKDFKMQPAHSGAALIAVRANALIVPVAFTGTEKFKRNPDFGPDGKPLKPHITIRVGEPYRLPRTDANGRKLTMDELTDLMMSKVAALLPSEYQGEYAPARVAERRTALVGRGRELEVAD